VRLEAGGRCVTCRMATYLSHGSAVRHMASTAPPFIPAARRIISQVGIRWRSHRFVCDTAEPCHKYAEPCHKYVEPCHKYDIVAAVDHLGDRCAPGAQLVVDSNARCVLRSIERGLNRMASIRFLSVLNRYAIGPRHTPYSSPLQPARYPSGEFFGFIAT
jgi:hypothetical protein